MLFQSPEYVLPLAGCVLAVILLPRRGRWPVLLAARLEDLPPCDAG